MPQEPPGFDDFYDDDFDPTRKVWFVPTIAQVDSEFAKRLRWDLFLGGTVLGSTNPQRIFHDEAPLPAPRLPAERGFWGKVRELFH